MERLKELIYVVEHNPNRKPPFLVRLVGKDSHRIDKKPVNETKDILGYGKTLVEAARNALKKKSEKKKIRYKAHYVRKGASPFTPSFPRGDCCSITSDEVPEDTPIEQIEKFAKKRTPRGFQFTKVVPVKE